MSSNKTLHAALTYHEQGMSLIPCRTDKRPALRNWKGYQTRRASRNQINGWFGNNHTSIGIILGAVSKNLVAIDLDGLEAVAAFYEEFPRAHNLTYTVKTGSGTGQHLYFRVDHLPANLNVRTERGGFEIRAEGCYVIAPPSPHPSGNRYTLAHDLPIAHISHLEHAREWMESLRETAHRTPVGIASMLSGKPRNLTKSAYLNAVISGEIARIQSAQVGERNNALFYATLRLANFCAGGELNRYEVEARLLSAAQHVNLPPLEAERTIQSGFKIGWKQPRTVPMNERTRYAR